MATIKSGLGVIVARIAGESPAMDAAAERVRAAVVANAAPHTDTGAFVASLSVDSVDGKKGVRDRAVLSDDPNAMSIEFGHMAHGKRPHWVPGIHAFGKAAYHA